MPASPVLAKYMMEGIPWNLHKTIKFKNSLVISCRLLIKLHLLQVSGIWKGGAKWANTIPIE